VSQASKAATKLNRLLVFLGSVLLSACSVTPTTDTSEAYLNLPPSYALDHLPFYPQIEDQCGPASLATMLSARDVHVEPETLRGKIYIPGKQGSVTTEIIARARKYGMVVYPLAPELPDILTEISGGNPVLVMQNLGYNWMPRWHFSVVIGYNLELRRVILRSGNEASHEVDFDLFIKTWDRAQRWAVVITDPTQLPATAKERIYIGAVNQLEQVNEKHAALTAYQTALARWPKNALANFGAGNTAYTLGRFHLAQAYFAHYLTLQPDSAEGWNNMAYSLMQLKCKPQSLDAISCALELDPNNTFYLESQRELLKANSAAQPASCPSISCGSQGPLD
jgi:tetratricopeptide (TPR) repeat protein